MAFSRGRAERKIRGRPTCNNCQTGNCHRCPTAITAHGVTGFESSFDCECYAEAPGAHAELVEADNPEFGGHGRDNDSWDSKGGVFDW